jgi:hypothetical protein
MRYQHGEAARDGGIASPWTIVVMLVLLLALVVDDVAEVVAVVVGRSMMS